MNTKLIDQILEEWKSHAPHNENNLCDACKLKRALWGIRSLQNLCEKVTVNAAKEMKEKDWSFPGFVMEMICLGFDLGIEYDSRNRPKIN
jgi:hypothetical protein